MEESEWQQSSDLQALLAYLRGRASGRKLRLFAVACCRHRWPLLTDPRWRSAVEVAERYADGEATNQERATAAKAFPWKDYLNSLEAAVGYAAGMVATLRGTDAALGASVGSAVAAHWAARNRLVSQGMDRETAREEGRRARQAEQACQLSLLRDLCGNPFRPLSVNPAWLTWNNGTIPRLAQSAYEERQMPEGTLDPVRLAVLADALEEAGCTDAEMLGHLHGPGPHVRGCHVLDALLGRS